jgi:homoserine kinase
VRPHRGSSHDDAANPAGQRAGSGVRVRVPASSANLGPGFDAFAAAVALHLELEVRDTGAFAVDTDLAIARDRRNLVVRGFARLASPERFAFRIASAIPLAGGLGSSAAAYVAGLLAADRLHDCGADVLALASALEGHPDNVAAALHGGFVVCADGAVTRLRTPPELEAVLVVPDRRVRTKAARAALPGEVPIGDAVFNTAHGALLAAGLERGDLDLVARGLADRLHQPRREHLYPRSMELVRRAPVLGALGATISGAGPTVLVWCVAGAADAVAAALRAEAEGWARVLRVPLEDSGAVVRDL